MQSRKDQNQRSTKGYRSRQRRRIAGSVQAAAGRWPLLSRYPGGMAPAIIGISRSVRLVTRAEVSLKAALVSWPEEVRSSDTRDSCINDKD
jgi:hypothetical protein